ncbi:MAG: hypothetical protein HZC54_15380 [Verrucomicrobia bacterium]|nr:hypothetical protein [Verrucomicrobiota bacterium]
MTNEELLAKAIECLRGFTRVAPDPIRDVTVDRLPKRRFRDAVVIDFSSDEDRGKIQIVLERDTGATISVTHSPPKFRQEKQNAG